MGEIVCGEVIVNIENVENFMIKFICFGSGSSGNCYYLQSDNYGIVIDLGIGIRTFKKYFKDYGFSFDRIKGILVTHDHTDHIKAVGVLSREFHIPVYATESVHAGMDHNYFMSKKVERENKKVIEVDTPIQLGPFMVTPFHVPHDSSSCQGYFVQEGNVKFCLITDAGCVTPEMMSHLKAANYIVLEANYDPMMLEAGPYPAYLKRRIAGPKGHLSNYEAATTLVESNTPETKRVWLCHTSEENNHPELVRKTIEAAYYQNIPDAPPAIEVLKRKQPSLIYELE